VICNHYTAQTVIMGRQWRVSLSYTLSLQHDHLYGYL
jgi:hypothetical protein